MYHLLPVPATCIPNSSPLPHIAVITVEHFTFLALAIIERALAITGLRKNLSLARKSFIAFLGASISNRYGESARARHMEPAGCLL